MRIDTSCASAAAPNDTREANAEKRRKDIFVTTGFTDLPCELHEVGQFISTHLKRSSYTNGEPRPASL